MTTDAQLDTRCHNLTDVDLALLSVGEDTNDRLAWFRPQKLLNQLAGQLLAAREKMHWTRRFPTQNGWYWRRDNNGGRKQVIEVEDGCLVYEGRRCPMSPYGEWAGPITPPGGDAVEVQS